MVDTVTLEQASAPLEEDVNITAGDSEIGNGKSVNIRSGAGASGGNGSGSINLLGTLCADEAGGQGGLINLAAGTSINDNGAEVFIHAGDGGGDGNRGGHVLIEAGSGDDGGDIMLTPGITTDDGAAGHVKIVGLENFADDAAAATGGVPVSGLYRTASAVKVRVA